MDNIGFVFRNEYKYLVSAGQIAMLKARAGAVLFPDPHVPKSGNRAGMYNIRSVYFDDREDVCYLENENGTDPREKFRIRIYNHSDQRITLELKRKQQGKCLKFSCPLTRQQCDTLLAGTPLPDDPGYPPLLQKLLLQMKTRGLQPVVIVEYDRIPYVFPAGNVRVTLDTNIMSSDQCQGFFEDRLSLRPVLPLGQHILEVKWDELLPDFLYRSLMLDCLQWSSFSKYYICRKLQKESYYLCTSKTSSSPAF